MTTTPRLNFAVGLLLLSIASAMAAPSVEVNGRLVVFSAKPIQLDSTVLVPVREIGQALGANVVWNAAKQTVTATMGTNSVRLTIGRDDALVNGRTVALAVPAMIYRGATMVPVAFLSKSLGADVRWNEGAQRVSIFTNGAPSSDPYSDDDDEWSSPREVVIPQGTVVPVSLDEALTLRTGQAGGTFSVTVRSSYDGDAEFPRGTRLTGTSAGTRVSNAARRPQRRDVSFFEARLPGGSRVPLEGSMISLDDKSVTRSADGRLVATATSGRGGGRPADVVLTAGSVFGVRLDREVSYDAPRGFAAARDTYFTNAAASDDQYPYDGQWTGLQRVAIPQATVIPVSLDTALSSATSRLGDGFSVTVRSSQDGDAEFPRGTRLVGVLVGVQRANAGQPGMLDLSFREARLPDGSMATIDGSLISLDDKTVTRSADGRLVATARPTKDNRLKMIGIGAGAGLIIGKLLDQNLIVGGLLGAAAGYFYNEYTTDKVAPADVVVEPGTIFGVRMDRDVSYSASSTFADARDTYFASDGPDNDQYPYDGQWTGLQRVAIPEATVVPVSLDTALSSATSRLGDTFSVTVRSGQDGDAEFPRGTRLVGVLVGVQKAEAGQPGMLDLSFREARLPDGSKATIEGSLISLDDRTVTTSADGRLVATARPTKDNRLKMIGIGAGAGLIIGKLLDQNLIVGGLLGAAAGYFYNEYTTDKVKPTDVVVKPGTVFGVRMDRDVSYSASSTFADARDTYLNSR